MPTIFVSYSHSDIEYTKSLITRLRRFYGHHEVWFDENLKDKGGHNWVSLIQKAIDESEIFLFLISKESLASQYCRQEFSRAKKQGKHIIGVLIEQGVKVPRVLSNTQLIFLNKVSEDTDAYTDLLTSINDYLKTSRNIVVGRPNDRTSQSMHLDNGRGCLKIFYSNQNFQLMIRLGIFILIPALFITLVIQNDPMMLYLDKTEIAQTSVEMNILTPSLTSTETPTIPTTTNTPTETPTVPTATNTPTETPTIPTATNTPTETPTIPTATNTPSETPTIPTTTNTPTETPTIPTTTNTPTETPTVPTATNTQITVTPAINTSQMVEETGTQSSTAIETTPVATTSISFYVCLFSDDDYHLLEVEGSEAVALIFDRASTVAVYSSDDLIVDIINILPDTLSGTYRWTDDIVSATVTQSFIFENNTCQTHFPNELSGLAHSIEIPITTDQAVTIRTVDSRINYQTANPLFIDAVGFVFDSESENEYPNFQLLRLSGGESEDSISLTMPSFNIETSAYMVSRQRITYTTTDRNGFRSLSKLIDSRERFLSRLYSVDSNLLDSVLIPGNFRFLVEYGEEISFEPNTVISLSRQNEFIPRDFVVGEEIEPISCDDQILAVEGYEPFRVPFFRASDYTPYLYLQSSSGLVVGTISCSNTSSIQTISEVGILEIEGGFYIASWLVQPVLEN